MDAASVRPSGEKATEVACSLSASKRSSDRPVAALHNLIPPLFLALSPTWPVATAIVSPLGEKARDCTGLPDPWNVCFSFLVVTSHNLIVPLALPAARV